MSGTSEIRCDACGADITSTGNCEDFRLKLASETKSAASEGAVTDLAIRPPLLEPKHFCDLRCLRDWLVRVGDYA